MAIEWYPGHMSKARRQIADVIQTYDVIIEILDARLPASSANPMLGKLQGNKPWIKVLNKNDLADPAVTKAWVEHFEQQSGVRALPLEARQHADATYLLNLCRKLVPTRGKAGRPIRAMVIGIPNVGKSTLINTLAGKAIAKVGDKPAITTCQQQIDLRNGIFLYDTPGVLWPDLRDQVGAYRLATSGSIGSNAFDAADVALFAIAFLVRRYPLALLERYKFTELPETPIAILEELGRRRGCLISGGGIDLHRAAEVLLRELRAGLLGRISLEEPGEEREITLPDETETDEPAGL